MSHSQVEFFAVILYSITFNFIFLAILFKIEDFLGYKPLLSATVMSIVFITVLCFTFKYSY